MEGKNNIKKKGLVNNMKNMNNERNLKEKRNNKRKTNNKYRYYTSYYDEDYYGSRTLDDYEVRNIKVVEIW